jgi:hypothetical protein
LWSAARDGIQVMPRATSEEVMNADASAQAPETNRMPATGAASDTSQQYIHIGSQARESVVRFVPDLCEGIVKGGAEPAGGRSRSLAENRPSPNP